MSVLVLAPPADEHARAVAAEIDRLGGAVQIVDVASFPERASLAMRFDCCSGHRAATILTDGGLLELNRVGSVWWRRPGHPVVAEEVTRPSHRAFALNETFEALGGLWSSLDAFWVNDPAADDHAARKPHQLGVAQRLGLEIPRTLMTNDPAEAVAFVDALGYREVVYKTFSSTQAEWRETRRFRPEEIELLPLVQHAPVIFQRFVPAVHDLRITVVGDELFPAAIHSQETAYPVDSRIDIGNARIEPAELPDELTRRLVALTRELGLVYGAIDMRLTPDGRYVFLEINPAGQYLYIEYATGLPITAALAGLLTAQDRERLAAGQSRV